MVALISTFMFTPLGPEFSSCYPAWATFEYTPFLFDPHRCAKMEYAPARVVRLRRILSNYAASGVPKRKSSGLKLFGMSKCTARTQENGLRKCFGMRALQSMRVSSPLESVFAKNLGGP